MRMPTEADMSQEQTEIYIDAPLDGKVMVTGPPGTGKTVIAFLRARTVAKKNKRITVAMYQNVLKQYATSAAENKFDVSTMHKWWKSWWNNFALPPSGASAIIKGKMGAQDVIFLPGCQGLNRAKVNELFGTPFKNNRGIPWNFRDRTWCVWKDYYEENANLFQPYVTPKDNLPMMGEWGEDGQFDHDFDKIMEYLVENKDRIDKDKVNWGHLIIDESQDMSPNLHMALKFISSQIFKDTPAKDTPALTLFADENQRLHEDNSTIDDILKAQNIESDRHYELTRNYRNTLEIALLASHFYVGLPTGIPKLPERLGDKPKLLSKNNIKDTIKFIFNYARNHENQEIGIFVQNHSQRKKYVKAMIKEIDDASNKNLTVQSYDYNDPDWKDADELKFDKSGIISIFTKQMSKGLEFDAVFIVEMQSIKVEPAAIDEFRMGMYVLTSRARNNLFLMLNINDDTNPEIASYLPEKKQGLIEYPNDE